MAAPSVVGTPSITNFPGSFADVSSYTITRAGVTAGNMLVIWHCGVDTLSAVSTVSGGGATWAKQQGGSSSVRGELWVGTGTTGGSITITITPASPDCVGGTMYEVSNAASVETSSLVTHGVATTIVTPTMTPLVTGDLVLVGAGMGNSPTSNPSAPWTDSAGPTENPGAFTFAPSAYQASTTASTGYSATWGTATAGTAGMGFGIIIAGASVPTGILFKQSTNGNATSSPTVTTAFSSSVSVGDLIVVTTSDDSGVTSVSAVTDSKGNTYARIVVVGSTSSYQRWYTVVQTGGSSFTVSATWNTGNTGRCTLVAQEFNGFIGTPILDKSSTNGSTSTSATSGATSSTTRNQELVVGGLSYASTASTVTLGTGYTNLDGVNAANASVAQESQVVSVTAAQTATFTIGASRAYIAGVDTFYDAGVASTLTGFSSITGISTITF